MDNCPHCGYALKVAGAMHYGNVAVTALGEVIYGGKVLEFYPSSRIVTEALIRARGRAVTRDALMNLVDCDGDTRAVDAYISRARRVFRQVNPSFAQIKNVRDFGYRWVSEEAASNVVRMTPRRTKIAA